MNCRDVRKYLAAFIDDELDVRANVEILEHAEMCPKCVRRIEALDRQNDLVRGYISGVKAPRGLEERIIADLRGGWVEAEPSVAPDTLFRKRWFHMAAAAASILVVFGVVYAVLLAPRAQFNHHAISAHVSVMHDDMTVFCFTSDPVRARRMALLGMGEEPTVPLFDGVGFELVGAGPAEIEHKNVGHFVFRYKAAPVSLFVFEGLGLDEIDGSDIVTRMGAAKSERRGNWSLLGWQKGGFTYIMVGELGISELVDTIGGDLSN